MRISTLSLALSTLLLLGTGHAMAAFYWDVQNPGFASVTIGSTAVNAQPYILVRNTSALTLYNVGFVVMGAWIHEWRGDTVVLGTWNNSTQTWSRGGNLWVRSGGATLSMSRTSTNVPLSCPPPNWPNHSPALSPVGTAILSGSDSMPVLWLGTLGPGDSAYVPYSTSFSMGSSSGMGWLASGYVVAGGFSATPMPATFGAGGSPTNPAVPVSEPVNSATGNYYSSHLDLSVPGKGPNLAFTRYYNSQDPYNGPLGAGWTHSYNAILSVNSSAKTATVKFGDGHEESWAADGSGAYGATTPGSFQTLRRNADGSYVLTRRDHLTLKWAATSADNTRRLTEVADSNGNTERLSYDPAGRLTLVTDPGGRTLVLTYDSAGRLATITGPLNRSVTYSYDAVGTLTAVRDSAGGLWTYAYDDSHRLTSATDARGNTYVRNTYDELNRVIEQKNARGHATVLTYNTPSPGTTTITDPAGKATQYIYDGKLRPVAVIDPLGNRSAAVFDANNLRIEETDPRGGKTKFEYDSHGNLKQRTGPEGTVTKFVFDSADNLLSRTDANSNTWSFTYDARSNVTIITDAAGAVTNNTYDRSGLLLTTTNPLGAVTTYGYDSYGNQTSVQNALGQSTQITFDAAGRAIAVKNPLGNIWARSYDAMDRLLSISDPLGGTVSYEYDGNSNLTKRTDANGHTTRYTYDADNHLTAVTDAIGGVTVYTYDETGRCIAVKDANGHTRQFTYDGADRLTGRTDPLGRQRQYLHDAAGNLASTTDGNGKTNTFTYDNANRLTGASLSGGAELSFSYDGNDNRIGSADPRGTTSYAFDGLNRLVTVRLPDGKSVGYAYDRAGNRTGVTYPDGQSAQYTYDAANRLISVTDTGGAATAYQYDTAGRTRQILYPNGAVTTYDYDAADRLIRVVNKSAGKTLSSFAYVLDGTGNRLRAEGLSGVSNQYTYDDLSRLTSWTAPSGQVTRYSYDAVGNRKGVTTSAGVTAYTYDAADQLLSAGATTFTYDRNGNRLTRTARGVTTNYTWDSLDRLASVTGGTANTRYAYDPEGNRVAQDVPAGSFSYINDVNLPFAEVLNESGPDGNLKYTHGTSPISVKSTATQLYYQHDGLGSVVSVTDQAGAQKASYAYDPWGVLLNAADPLPGKNKTRFAGETWDANAGLIYLRARYYDPSVGAFLNPDPSGTGSYSVPSAGIAPYVYAAANPLRNIDPSGLSAIDSSAPRNYSNDPQWFDPILVLLCYKQTF